MSFSSHDLLGNVNLYCSRNLTNIYISCVFELENSCLIGLIWVIFLNARGTERLLGLKLYCPGRGPLGITFIDEINSEYNSNLHS